MNYPGFSDSQNISARRDQSIEGVVLAGGAGTHLYLLKKVGDPERSGTAAIDGRNRVIPEAEENPRSNNAVTRVYMYDPGVFDMIRRTKPSAHGELETNSADSEHRKQNNLTYGIVGAERMDTSAVELYQHANALLFSIDNTIQPGEYHADTL